MNNALNWRNAHLMQDDRMIFKGVGEVVKLIESLLSNDLVLEHSFDELLVRVRVRGVADRLSFAARDKSNGRNDMKRVVECDSTENRIVGAKDVDRSAYWWWYA